MRFDIKITGGGNHPFGHLKNESGRRGPMDIMTILRTMRLQVPIHRYIGPHVLRTNVTIARNSKELFKYHTEGSILLICTFINKPTFSHIFYNFKKVLQRNAIKHKGLCYIKKIKKIKTKQNKNLLL